MYVATKAFKSPHLRKTFKKGDEVPYNKAWLDGGLIEEGKPAPKKETKPEPAKKKATK